MFCFLDICGVFQVITRVRLESGNGYNTGPLKKGKGGQPVFVSVTGTGSSSAVLFFFRYPNICFLSQLPEVQLREIRLSTGKGRMRKREESQKRRKYEKHHFRNCIFFFIYFPPPPSPCFEVGTSGFYDSPFPNQRLRLAPRSFSALTKLI